MRVETGEQFRPIIVVLESQEEVDKLYAVCTCVWLSDALDLDGWWEQLTPYASKHSDNYVMAIRKS